jgi:nucleoid DNA-binding protein
MNTITKGDMVDKMAKKVGITKAQALVALDTFTETVSKGLVKGQETRIKGFGTFRTLNRDERKGRNPQTGEALVTPPRRVIRFLPATALAEEVKPIPGKGK